MGSKRKGRHQWKRESRRIPMILDLQVFVEVLVDWESHIVAIRFGRPQFDTPMGLNGIVIVASACTCWEWRTTTHLLQFKEDSLTVLLRFCSSKPAGSQKSSIDFGEVTHRQRIRTEPSEKRSTAAMLDSRLSDAELKVNKMTGTAMRRPLRSLSDGTKEVCLAKPPDRDDVSHLSDQSPIVSRWEDEQLLYGWRLLYIFRQIPISDLVMLKTLKSYVYSLQDLTVVLSFQRCGIAWISICMPWREFP